MLNYVSEHDDEMINVQNRTSYYEKITTHPNAGITNYTPSQVKKLPKAVKQLDTGLHYHEANERHVNTTTVEISNSPAEKHNDETEANHGESRVGEEIMDDQWAASEEEETESVERESDHPPTSCSTLRNRNRCRISEKTLQIIAINTCSLAEASRLSAFLACFVPKETTVILATETRSNGDSLRMRLNIEKGNQQHLNGVGIFATHDQRVPRGSGTAIILGANLACRVKSSKYLEGYVAAATIAKYGPDGEDLLVISVYWPHTQNESPTRNHVQITNFVQQQIIDARARGNTIVVGGDFNGGTSSGILHDIMLANGLIDLFNLMNPNENGFTFPIRNDSTEELTSKLDYIYASPRLATTTLFCRTSDHRKQPWSDHLGIIATLPPPLINKAEIVGERKKAIHSMQEGIGRTMGKVPKSRCRQVQHLATS
jgi:exonuclease III